MKVLRLDHVTINTDDLERTLAFYDHFLDLKPGFRPTFTIGGAWLYPKGGDYPIVHVIERPRPEGPNYFDHIAFRSEGLDAYLSKVEAADVSYTAMPVPETALVQVQHHDPNGILIEVTFENEEISSSRIIPTFAVLPRHLED